MPAKANPGAGGWSGIYRTFVMDGYYLSSGEYYTTDGRPYSMPIKFALYDMDSDGTPELFVFNGAQDMGYGIWDMGYGIWDMAGCANYVYEHADRSHGIC